MEEIKKIIKDFIDSDGVVEVPDYALISLYGAMKSLFYKFDKMVAGIGFELLYPDEGEQRDIYRQRDALDDFCAALRRQIKFHQRKREVMEQMMFQTQHDPNFDDVDPEQKAQAMATHHCGQDADMDDACCQVRSSRVDHTAAPAAVKELPDSIAQLVGMQIVSAFRPGWKCEECAFSHIEGARCEKKVELVGGCYLCLAPIPIVTE